jgi:hypothetical protein
MQLNMLGKLLKFGLVTIFFLLLIVASCNDRRHISPQEIVEINVNLTSKEIYQYDLGEIPIEGGFSIIKVAKNSRICTIKLSNKNKWVLEYQSIADFGGNDFVELRNCISAGGSECSQIIHYQFYFAIER